MRGRLGKWSPGTIVKAMQFPEDFVRGCALVAMEGQNRVTVENFRGILSCTLQEIRLIAGQKKLCITGKGLRIDSYSREEIEISGTIEKLEYL